MKGEVLAREVGSKCPRGDPHSEMLAITLALKESVERTSVSRPKVNSMVLVSVRDSHQTCFTEACKERF